MPRSGIEYGIGFEELRLHFGIAFEAAGGNDHAAARGDMTFLAVLHHGDADDFASRRIGDQSLRTDTEADVDAGGDDVVVNHLEQFRTVRRTVGPGIVFARVKAGHVDDRRVIEGVGAGQRIVAADLPAVGIAGLRTFLVFFNRSNNTSIVDGGQFTYIRFEFAHALS